MTLFLENILNVCLQLISIYLNCGERCQSHDWLSQLYSGYTHNCISTAEAMGSNTVQTWIFFRLQFHNSLSCVYNCDNPFISQSVGQLVFKIQSMRPSACQHVSQSVIQSTLGMRLKGGLAEICANKLNLVNT